MSNQLQPYGNPFTITCTGSDTPVFLPANCANANVSAITGQVQIVLTSGGPPVSTIGIDSFVQVSAPIFYLRANNGVEVIIQPLSVSSTSSPSPIKPLICSNRSWKGDGPNAGSADTWSFFQSQYKMMFEGYDIRLVYHNWVYNVGSQASPGYQELATVTNPITIKSGFGYTLAGALTFHRVTFGGQPSVLLNPGSFVVSDPIGLQLPNQTAFQVNTLVQAAAASYRWPSGGYGWGNMEGNGANEFLISGSGALPGTDWTMVNMTAAAHGADYAPYEPFAIIAIPKNVGQKVFAFVGDSVAFGSTWFQGSSSPFPNSNGDGVVEPGLFAYWCYSQGIPFLNIASPGNQGGTELNATAARYPLLTYCTDALLSLGTNELSHYGQKYTAHGSVGYVVALPDIENDYNSVVKTLQSRGLVVHAVTMPPRAASGDANLYLVPSSQTPVETGANDPANDNEPARVLFLNFQRTGSIADKVIDLNSYLNAGPTQPEWKYGNDGVGFSGHVFTVATAGGTGGFTLINADATTLGNVNGAFNNCVIQWTKLNGSTTILAADQLHYVTAYYANGAIAINGTFSVAPIVGDTFQLAMPRTADGTHPLCLFQLQSDKSGLSSLVVNQ